MKRAFFQISRITVLTLVLLAAGCKAKLPEVSVDPPADITGTSAKVSGNILSEGKTDIDLYGFFWDTVPEPTLQSNTWKDSVPAEQFKAEIKGLSPRKTYYIKSFARNSLGISLSEAVKFETPASAPVLITRDPSDVFYRSAKSGGKIVSDGGYPVKSYGVCWDTLPAPDINDAHTTDSIYEDGYHSEIDGLIPERKYFARAYAVNAEGTGYGNETEFTTQKIAPLVTRFTVTERYLHSASCNVSEITIGGPAITEYGAVWGINPDPTLDDSRTSKPFARNKFRLTGLKAGTKYYVRLYAINAAGTHYGNSYSFTTLGRMPKAETLPASDMTTSGARLKGTVNAGFLPTTVTIEYGTTEAYGQTAKISTPVISGSNDTTIVAEIKGLKSGTLIHFRIKASNELGTVAGKDETFTVLITPELKNFPPITLNYRDSEFHLTPPASTSPAPVRYISSDPKVAVIEGEKVVVTGSGVCTITAYQAPYGNYTEGSISATLSKNVIDIDGNVYNTVRIGDQDWMKENLRVTRYRNGDQIPNVTDQKAWVLATGGAMSAIRSDSVKVTPAYGALYNWYAVNDPRRICPTGWHVPTDAEWQVMERHLGMTFAEADETIKRGTDQGVQLKDSTGWFKGGNGTNSSEFSGLPAGMVMAESGTFHNVGIDACFWTSTEQDATTAWMRNMYYNLKSIYRITDFKVAGFSVRCVRDRRR